MAAAGLAINATGRQWQIQRLLLSSKCVTRVSRRHHSFLDLTRATWTIEASSLDCMCLGKGPSLGITPVVGDLEKGLHMLALILTQSS
jgi:hypothetical protein